MIVVMQAHCKDEAIEHVMQFLDVHGLSGHLSQGVERTIIGVLGAVGSTGTRTTAGGINPSISDALEGLPGVEQVLTVSKPYKLASREFHPINTIVEVPAACVSEGVVRIGDDAVLTCHRRHENQECARGRPKIRLRPGDPVGTTDGWQSG